MRSSNYIGTSCSLLSSENIPKKRRRRKKKRKKGRKGKMESEREDAQHITHNAEMVTLGKQIS
jgi:hypothetical protein